MQQPQQRDFVGVYDIARACRLALELSDAVGSGGVFNVGSGRPRTVLEVAEKMAAVMGKEHQGIASGAPHPAV